MPNACSDAIGWRSVSGLTMTTRGDEKGHALPSGREIDRLNEIANGLAAVSLALDVGAGETAKMMVNQTLTRASALLSEAVVEARVRERRRRRARWGAGSAMAGAAAAGLALLTPISTGLPVQPSGTISQAAPTPDVSPIREIAALGPGGLLAASTLDASKRDREAVVVLVHEPAPSDQPTVADPPPLAESPQVPDVAVPEASDPETEPDPGLDPGPDHGPGPEPDPEAEPEPTHPSGGRSQNANPPDNAGPPDKAGTSDKSADRRQNA